MTELCKSDLSKFIVSWRKNFQNKRKPVKLLQGKVHMFSDVL
jgi:hypothetical protein